MLLMVYCTTAFISLSVSVCYITFYFWNDVLMVKLATLKSKCSRALNSSGQSWEHVCDDAYCYYNYIETRL